MGSAVYEPQVFKNFAVKNFNTSEGASGHIRGGYIIIYLPHRR